jgi:hypothetical protein
MLCINHSSRSRKTSVYSGAELQQLSQNFTVLSVIDNDPPEVIDMAFSPDPIDINDSDGVSNTSILLFVY